MRLFVGNLSFQTTEDDLRDAFSQHGSITDLKIMTDRMTGRSRGFAFVTFSSQAEGETAIRALDGQPLAAAHCASMKPRLVKKAVAEAVAPSSPVVRSVVPATKRTVPILKAGCSAMEHLAFLFLQTPFNGRTNHRNRRQDH
jgi:RNA recognition motif-containing protein